MFVVLACMATSSCFQFQNGHQVLSQLACLALEPFVPRLGVPYGLGWIIRITVNRLSESICAIRYLGKSSRLTG